MAEGRLYTYYISNKHEHTQEDRHVDRKTTTYKTYPQMDADTDMNIVFKYLCEF